MRKRKLIIEPDGGSGILTMDEDGVIQWFPNPEAVREWVTNRDAHSAVSGEGFIVTVLEWRNFPPGFVPPEGPA